MKASWEIRVRAYQPGMLEFGDQVALMIYRVRRIDGVRERQRLDRDGAWVEWGETISLGAAVWPTALMQIDEANELTSNLWRAGGRPYHGEATTGQLAALESHLADLRAVAFHALKILPGEAKRRHTEGGDW